MIIKTITHRIKSHQKISDNQTFICFPLFSQIYRFDSQNMSKIPQIKHYNTSTYNEKNNLTVPQNVILS